jgi:hypothetical protein
MGPVMPTVVATKANAPTWVRVWQHRPRRTQCRRREASLRRLGDAYRHGDSKGIYLHLHILLIDLYPLVC